MTDTRPPLRPYQVAGVQFLRDRPRAYLADDPGLGKTRQLIQASRGDTLVLAPAMVLDGGTWTSEVAKWGDDPDRFTYVPYTSLCARETVLGEVIWQRNEDGGRIFDDNDDPIPERDKNGDPRRKRSKSRVLQIPRREYTRNWDTVICDEAQLLKGRGTSWTKAMIRVARRADNVYLASGTPISNYAPELFSPLQLLYPEEARPGGKFGSYWRWVETWFRVNTSFYNEHARDIGDLLMCSPACLTRDATDPCDHYQEFFAANLGDRYMQRLRDDVLTDLPPMNTQTIETPMTKKQGAEYKRMKKDCLAQDMDGNMKVVWSKSAAHIKLDQIATGLGVLTGTGEESGKLERLRFDLAGRSHPTLVVAHYRATVQASADVARSVGAKTAQIDGGTSKADRLRHVQDFQAGKLDVLVGSLETVAEGLTLTAADAVYFVEHSWKPSRNQQAFRRIHRMGQTRPCTAYDYVTPDSVDVGKRELLARKLDRQIRTLSWGVVRDLL